MRTLLGAACALLALAITASVVHAEDEPKIHEIDRFGSQHEKMRRLMSWGAHADALRTSGCARLGYAVSKGGYFEDVRLLLIGGADPKLECDGKTPLHHLLSKAPYKEAWLDALQALLEAGADPRERVGKKRVAELLAPADQWPEKIRPLHAEAEKLLAAHRRARRTLSVPLRPLLERGERADVELALVAIHGGTMDDAPDAEGLGPLSWGIALIADDILRGRYYEALDARGVKPTKADLPWLAERWRQLLQKRTAPLFAAVLKAEKKRLLEGEGALGIWDLLDAEASVEATVVALEAGVDPHQVNAEGETVLTAYARGEGDAGVVKAALAAGLSQLNPKTLRPVLHEAVERGDEKKVEALLAVGVDPNVRDGDAVTALMRAASLLAPWQTREGRMIDDGWQRFRVARALIRAEGAIPGARDLEGRTAFHYAMTAYDSSYSHGTNQFVLAMNEAGARPSPADKPAVEAYVAKLKVFQERFRAEKKAEEEKKKATAEERERWERYLKTPVKAPPGAGESVDYGRGRCSYQTRRCGAACCDYGEICCMNRAYAACVPGSSSGWINGCPSNMSQH